MKKVYLLMCFLSVIAVSHAQDDNIGYTTTDVGAEAQWQSSGGYTGVVHIAFNGAVHSGFQLRAGYNITDRKDWGVHAVEKGGGPGGGIGYRYYFPFRPHQFFIGLRSDIWRLKIDWEDALLKGTTKTWTVHPAGELGYMFLINDMVFITPAFSAGYIYNVSTDGSNVGDGFVITAGISAGIKF